MFSATNWLLKKVRPATKEVGKIVYLDEGCIIWGIHSSVDLQEGVGKRTWSPKIEFQIEQVLKSVWSAYSAVRLKLVLSTLFGDYISDDFHIGIADETENDVHICDAVWYPNDREFRAVKDIPIELIKRGNLRMFCDIKKCGIDTSEKSTQKGIENGTEKLQQDFSELLFSGNNSDMSLKVKGEDFKVHRCILAARSSVFSAMLKHDTKEKDTGLAVIDDADPNSFQDFLYYLYTGSFDRVTADNVVNLYTISDKYEVLDLKEFCLKYMTHNVSTENFCNFLVLSLQYSEKEFKDLLTRFFVGNSSDIIMTVKWQAFLSENPIIGNELFVKVVNDRKWQ